MAFPSSSPLLSHHLLREDLLTTLPKYHSVHHLLPALPYFLCFLASASNFYLFQVPEE